MARFTIDYFSNALCRTTTFTAVIPNDIRTDLPWENHPEKEPSLKTLFLLHGYTGRGDCWIPEHLIQKYHVAVICPSAENSFYTNGAATGRAYETMVAVELVDYVRKTFRLAMTPEETFIAGLSMGGYGALHLGLAYPDRFGKIGAMSSALIVDEVSQMKPGQGNAVANYEYYAECFGEPLSEVKKRLVDPEAQVRALKDAGTAFPEIFMCCGTEDFLLEPNRTFHRFLEKEKVPHEYFETPGNHDMVFWMEYIAKILAWMFRDGQ